MYETHMRNADPLHTSIVANNAATAVNRGVGGYTLGIALDGMGGSLFDNLRRSLGNGIRVLDVVA
jgi:hypothetical protein